jgi:hypothetical protein
MNQRVEGMRLAAEARAWHAKECAEARADAIEEEIGRILDDPADLHKTLQLADPMLRLYDILHFEAERRIDTPEDIEP